MLALGRETYLKHLGTKNVSKLPFGLGHLKFQGHLSSLFFFPQYLSKTLRIAPPGVTDQETLTYPNL